MSKYLIHKVGDYDEKASGFRKASNIINNLSPEEKKNKTIILYLTDYNDMVDIRPNLKDKNYKNFALLRTALFKSKKLEYEGVYPWLESELFEFGPKSPTTKPTLGFCGASGGRYFHRKRAKLCKEFEACGSITTEFIHRRTYTPSRIRNNNAAKLRIDYVSNLKNNIFNMCYRGSGNFTMRFYEVLSAGRIPVLIRSDNELPFESHIDWQNKIVIADDVDEAVEKMLYLFKNKDLLKMQAECKEIHREYFTEEGFIKNLSKII